MAGPRSAHTAAQRPCGGRRFNCCVQLGTDSSLHSDAGHRPGAAHPHQYSRNAEHVRVPPPLAAHIATRNRFWSCHGTGNGARVEVDHARVRQRIRAGLAHSQHLRWRVRDCLTFLRLSRRIARVRTRVGAERAGSDLGSGASPGIPRAARARFPWPGSGVRDRFRCCGGNAIARDVEGRTKHRAFRVKRPSPVIRAATAAFRRIPPLRGRGRAEAIFHRWLSGSGLEDVIEVNGYSLEVSLDDIIGRSIYVNGIWERENTAVVRRLLSPGATVFDIGANTGYYTLLFSHLAGAHGRVYAFEPVPSTRAALERNVARAATSSNVQILPVAVSDHPGEVLIH